MQQNKQNGPFAAAISQDPTASLLRPPLQRGHLHPGPPAASQKAGLSWTCLIYRHTFGSQLAMKGESLSKIVTLMGNSAEICQRHYAALLPQALADTADSRRHPGLQPMTRNDLHTHIRLVLVKEVLELGHDIEHEGVIAVLHFQQDPPFHEIELPLGSADSRFAIGNRDGAHVNQFAVTVGPKPAQELPVHVLRREKRRAAHGFSWQREQSVVT
jgi:hypothetical protein